MKWLALVLLVTTLTPLAAARHDGEALVAHGERKKAAYLVLRLITRGYDMLLYQGSDLMTVIEDATVNLQRKGKFLA